jgi:hypothetical protein
MRIGLNRFALKEEEAAKRVEEARSIPRSEEYLAAVATLRGYASAWQNMISLSPFVGLIFILGGIGIALRRTLAKLSIRSYVNAFRSDGGRGYSSSRIIISECAKTD